MWSLIKRNLKHKKATRLRLWNSFCDETPFNGFIFYRNSQFRYEKALWLVLIAVATVVTLKDSINTINEYTKQDTVSRVTTEYNQSIVLPNPIICVDLSLDTMYHGSIDVTDSSLVANFLHKNRLEIIQIFNDTSINNSYPLASVMENTEDLLVPLLYLSTNMIASIVAAETGDFKNESKIINWGFNLKNVNLRTNSIMQMYRFFVDNKLNFGEAMKTTGMYLCSLMDLTVSKKYKYTQDQADCEDVPVANWCKREFVSWLGTSICVRPADTPKIFNFTSTYEGLAIHLKPQRIQPPANILVGFYFSRQQADFEMENAMVVSVGDKIIAEVELIQVNSVKTKHLDCTDDTDWSDCVGKCRAQPIITNCGCQPLSSVYFNCQNHTCGDLCPLYTQNATNGLIPLLSEPKCIDTLSESVSQWFTCSDQCQKTCFHQMFKFTKDKDDLAAGSMCQSDRTQVSFMVPRLSYLNIQQSLAIDDQTFMANLGGNLGFYIGGTIMALIHLVTSILRLIVSLVLAKDDVEDSSKAESAVPLLLQEESKTVWLKKIANLERENARIKAELRLILDHLHISVVSNGHAQLTQ